MSRYTKINETTGRLIAWGFDRPLGEYFVTEYWTEEEAAKQTEKFEEGAVDPEGFEDPEVRFSVMSRTTTCPHPDTPTQFNYSNSEIAEIMRQVGCSEEHIEAVELDLPY